MLFVNNDYAEISDRRKNSGSGSDDQFRLASPEPVPFVETFALAQVRMKYCHLRSEVRAQTAREEWSQGNLWNQHHSGAARIQSGTHRPYINLSLAATRYAVQKKCLKLFQGKRIGDFRKRPGLGIGQLQTQIVG